MKIKQKVVINNVPGVVTAVELVKQTPVYTIKLPEGEIRLTVREIALNK